MKRSILIAVAIIGILGSFATLAVATPITDLGTIDYYNTQDNFCINEDIPGNANLTHIYSEMNESALKLDKIWYDSFTDKTTYKFTTQKIFVEWWFTPSIKEFVYIDGNNNSLYRINVNYSEITIPENPYEERHQQLIENYTLILNNYNLTNSTLANITLQFNKLDDLYNLTMQQLNITLTEKQNLSENLTELRTAFTKLEEEYNKTDALWDSAVDNVTSLQTKCDGLSGDYDQLEKDHNDLSGAMPWYIIVAIIGTFLFTYIYIRRKAIFEPQTEATDEITTGYGKLHSAIDRHILSRFRKEPKTSEGGIEEVTEWDEVSSKEEIPIQKERKKEPIKNPAQDDILTAMHEKIDGNIMAINTKIDANARETDTKIENLFKGIDERFKQLAKGTKA